MKMDSIYVVMPAYNEEENIEAVVRQWYPVLEMAGEQSRLVIADNGSKDATHEILMKLKESMPQLEILEKTDRYHGPKVIALYKYAIKNGAIIFSRRILMVRQIRRNLRHFGSSEISMMRF